MKQECKTTKTKNKRQVTMTKGDRSAGGQRAQGDDLPISDAAGGNCKHRARSVAEPSDQ